MSGSALGRVFNIASETSVVMSDLDILDGKTLSNGGGIATGGDLALTHGHADGSGGGGGLGGRCRAGDAPARRGHVDCHRHRHGDRHADLDRRGSPALGTPTDSPTPTVTPPSGVCAGDCNGDGEVTIDELVLAVNIALGARPVADCLPADRNGNGTVTIEELITAVGNALGTCPG